MRTFEFQSIFSNESKVFKPFWCRSLPPQILINIYFRLHSLSVKSSNKTFFSSCCEFRESLFVKFSCQIFCNTVLTNKSFSCINGIRAFNFSAAILTFVRKYPHVLIFFHLNWWKRNNFVQDFLSQPFITNLNSPASSFEMKNWSILLNDRFQKVIEAEINFLSYHIK